MARAVSLESFFKLYHPQPEVVSCDTEDLLAKVSTYLSTYTRAIFVQGAFGTFN